MKSVVVGAADEAVAVPLPIDDVAGLEYGKAAVVAVTFWDTARPANARTNP